MSKYWQVSDNFNLEEAINNGDTIVIKTGNLVSIDEANWTLFKNNVYGKSKGLVNLISDKALFNCGVVELMVKQTSDLAFFIETTYDWLMEEELDKYVIIPTGPQ